MNAVVSLVLDTRRSKNKGKKADGQEDDQNKVYPVKIRVYFNYITRYYRTQFDLTETQFENAYKPKKLRKEYKNLFEDLDRLERRAKAVRDSLTVFTFERFEKNLLRKKGAGTDAFYHFREVIKNLISDSRIGTASNYESSVKSLLHFLFAKEKFKELKKVLDQTKRKLDFLAILQLAENSNIEVSLHFSDITKDFLTEYEKWMLLQGRSRTTIGIYLRPLRSVFNIAIEQEEITRESYPFGKKRYQIPQARNIKKALLKTDLQKLFDFPLEDHEKEMIKARDFWFFSYVCNGINTKDIAHLRYKNLGEEFFSFYRAKTINTSKENAKPIIVPLTDYSKTIISKYGNKRLSDETFIFPVIQDSMSADEQHRRVRAFTRFINQHIKRLAKLSGVTADISTYYARHTFTTVSIQNGASLAFIQESLGHSSITTTENYWAGFTDKIKRDNANKLMNFA
jgi:integrase